METKSPNPIGRPRSFDRDQALRRAMHVFWQKGFEGSSLHDLTTAMNIQPASLYAAFGNKETLFSSALDHYVAGPVDFMRTALEQPTAYAVAESILIGTVEFLSKNRARCGCMTIQAALVGGEQTAPVRSLLIHLRVKAQRALRRRFERARSEGDLPRHLNAGDLARFITTIFQGLTVQAIDGASRREMLRVAGIALQSVFPGEAARPTPERHGRVSQRN